MISISLEDFKKIQDVRFLNLSDNHFKSRLLKGISIDSRTIEPDQIFWAIKGNRFDGHDFVHEAFSKAALCVVVNEEYARKVLHDKLPQIVVPDTLKALQQLAHIHRQKYRIPVIAITGSNGKTTTKEMIAHVLQAKFRVHKTKGNLNNQIGCPLTLLDLNELHDIAVIEIATNQFGEIEILTQMLEPNHGLITLIGDSHLEFLNSRKGVAKEKMQLFRKMNKGGTVYVNADDPYLGEYSRKGLNVISFGFEKPADVKGKIGPLDKDGCGSLILNEKHKIKLTVPGIHNVQNALAAATVCLNMGIKAEEFAELIKDYHGFDKRMQIIKWKKALIINDTYNASPVSMKIAMNTASEMQRSGKMIFALGSMFELGKSSADMHLEILNYALKCKPDRIFLLGELMSDAMDELPATKRSKFVLAKNIKDLAEMIGQEISNGDILLIKGSRGMQMEKILAFLP